MRKVIAIALLLSLTACKTVNIYVNAPEDGRAVNIDVRQSGSDLAGQFDFPVK